MDIEQPGKSGKNKTNCGAGQQHDPHVVQVLPEQACPPPPSPSHLVSLQQTSRSCLAAPRLSYAFLSPFFFVLLSLYCLSGVPEACDVTQVSSVCGGESVAAETTSRCLSPGRETLLSCEPEGFHDHQLVKV